MQRIFSINVEVTNGCARVFNVKLTNNFNAGWKGGKNVYCIQSKDHALKSIRTYTKIIIDKKVDV